MVDFDTFFMENDIENEDVVDAAMDRIEQLEAELAHDMFGDWDGYEGEWKWEERRWLYVELYTALAILEKEGLQAKTFITVPHRWEMEENSLRNEASQHSKSSLAWKVARGVQQLGGRIDVQGRCMEMLSGMRR